MTLRPVLGVPSYTFREDAATDTAFITRQLTWLLEETHALYRPAFWRSFIRKTSNIPTWVQKVQITTVQDFARLVPSQYLGAALPKPTLSKTEKLVNMVSFLCGYDLMDRDVDRAAMTGTNVSSALPRANSTAAEQLLDTIASIGDPFGLGMVGLFNNTDVATVSGTGTAWASATFAQILSDCNGLVNAIAVGSLQNFKGDTLLVPLAQYQLMSSTRSSFDRTVLEVFMTQNPTIRRVAPWDRLKTAGSGGVTRACAFDSTAPEGPQMLVSKELTSNPALPKQFGVEIAQEMICGGVLIEQAQSVKYMDGI